MISMPPPGLSLLFPSPFTRFFIVSASFKDLHNAFPLDFFLKTPQRFFQRFPHLDVNSRHIVKFTPLLYRATRRVTPTLLEHYSQIPRGVNLS